MRAVGETQQRSDDSVLAEESSAEGRVLLTEDLDFGHLVFAQGARTAGVVLIRWEVTARSSLAARTVELAARRGPDLSVSFVVLEPGRTRFRRIPRS